MKKHEPKKQQKRIVSYCFQSFRYYAPADSHADRSLYDNYIPAAGIFDSNQRNHALHASYSNHLRNQFGGQSGHLR